jgi:hypothetical protein
LPWFEVAAAAAGEIRRLAAPAVVALRRDSLAALLATGGG